LAATSSSFAVVEEDGGNYLGIIYAGWDAAKIHRDCGTELAGLEIFVWGLLRRLLGGCTRTAPLLRVRYRWR
jgi:hypothetical protein